MQHGDPASAGLDVEEGIRDRDRYLVPKLRHADRVAVDEDVGHGRILTGTRALSAQATGA
jgi:hypothetical protein